MHIPDAEADPEYVVREAQRIGRFRTILGVPLLREGELIGVLPLMRSAVQPFTDKEIELAATFADQAVIAIENVRLFEEVQAKTNDLEEALTFQKATGDVLEVIGRSASTLAPVFEAIVDTAADLCRADMSVMRLMRDGSLHYVAASKRNDPAIDKHSQNNPILATDRTSVSGRVAVEARTIHIADVAKDPEFSYLSSVVGADVHSVLGVPLFQNDRLAGVITLLRRTVDPFTERQIALVETFADQAVIAIENVRLFEEVQARTAELEGRTRELTESLQQQVATSDVLKVISRSAFDLQAVLDTLIESAIPLCEAARGVIWLRRGEQLYLAAHVNYPEEWVEAAKDLRITPAPDAVTATGIAAFTGEILNVEDMLSDPRFSSLSSHKLGDYRGSVSVPLKRDDRVEGVIGLSRPTPGRFTERQLALLQTFADQAVIAIENVRLFEEVQARTNEFSESLQQQTATADVLKVISRSTFDLQAVLNALAATATRFVKPIRASSCGVKAMSMCLPRMPVSRMRFQLRERASVAAWPRTAQPCALARTSGPSICPMFLKTQLCRRGVSAAWRRSYNARGAAA